MIKTFKCVRNDATHLKLTVGKEYKCRMKYPDLYIITDDDGINSLFPVHGNMVDFEEVKQ